MSTQDAQAHAMETKDHKEITREQILRILPHRPPMLMVDRLIQVVSGESAVGIKETLPDEWYFKGHFEKTAVMPGVMIIEALAQTAAALAMDHIGVYDEDRLVYFMGIDGARFRKTVLPGDVLHLEVCKTHRRRNVWRFKGVAKVNGEVVAEAVKTAMIADD